MSDNPKYICGCSFKSEIDGVTYWQKGMVMAYSEDKVDVAYWTPFGFPTRGSYWSYQTMDRKDVIMFLPEEK